MSEFIKASKPALIGLIILFAVSSVMAGRGKLKIEKITSTMRPLSGKEAKELIELNPNIFIFALGEMADYSNEPSKWSKLSELKVDTGFLKRNLDIHELDNPFLKQIIPKAHFLRVNRIDIKPHIPFRINVISNKFYHMPTDFNHLLLEHNLKINNKNIIALAKTFVIITLEDQEITFLEEKRVKEERKIGNKKNVTYTAQLKVKVGDEIRNWYLPQDIYEKGQFGGATVTDKDDKVIKVYQLQIIETNQK